MNVLTDVVLPAALAFIMFSMGLSLSVADFRRVFAEPAAAAVGLAAQMLLLPLLAFAIVAGWRATFGLDAALAVGFLIIAACPGGVTSNLLTHLARGDTALSISLTAVASVASALTLPLIVGASMAFFLGAQAPPLPILDTVAGVFAIVTLPVLAGMAVKAAAPNAAERIEPFSRRAATVLFVAIVAGAVAVEWRLVAGSFADVGPLVLLLNLAAMAMGWAVAQAARLGRDRAIAITLEAGLQNGTLAVLIAATFLGDETMVVPGGVYSLIMFFTAALFVAAAARRPTGDRGS